MYLVQLLVELFSEIFAAAKLKDKFPGLLAGFVAGLVVEAEPCFDMASVLGQYFLYLNGGRLSLFDLYSHYLETIHEKIPPDIHKFV